MVKRAAGKSSQGPVSTFALTMVRVLSGDLCFGCMQGEMDGSLVTVLLCEKRGDRLVGGWPRQGDVLGCVQLYNSVYEPLCLFPQEDFSRYKLLRWCLPLPSDLIDEYFCPRKNIVRVSSPSFANA